MLILSSVIQFEKPVIPRSVSDVGIRSPKGITDCHGLAMTDETERHCSFIMRQQLSAVYTPELTEGVKTLAFSEGSCDKGSSKTKGEWKMSDIIQISCLSKRFGDVQAVKDLSFRVREGELFAFLGVNGAGKSTTIHILCGQLRRDGGSVRIDGRDLDREPDAVKRSLGVVFQSSVLDSALTVTENLESRAALYGITGAAFRQRLAELAKLLDFEDLLRRTVGKLSGGQRRRIDVARALLHRPRILILDEPTTGLDPQTRNTLWRVIADLRKTEHMTVFLTTHYMEEAAEADYVVILDAGAIAAEGTPLTLKNTYTGDFITLYSVPEEAVKALGVPYEPVRDAWRLCVADTAAATELIVKHPESFRDYEITKGKMDDVFLAVTGRKLTGGERK